MARGQSGNGADLKTVLYILLGSFGGAKEMNRFSFIFE